MGFYLAKRFLQDEDTKLILLARSSGNLTARQRVERLFQIRCSEEKYKSIKDRLEIIEGSITSPNLGLSKEQIERLSKKVVTIFHSAALAQFNVPYEKIKKINVDGTKNVLDFALECAKNQSFESVNHISTIAVSGTYRGILYEDSLDEGQGFKNTYEQTKFEAEQLIQVYRAKGLNVNILNAVINISVFCLAFEHVFSCVNDFNHLTTV